MNFTRMTVLLLCETIGELRCWCRVDVMTSSRNLYKSYKVSNACADGLRRVDATVRRNVPRRPKCAESRFVVHKRFDVRFQRRCWCCGRTRVSEKAEDDDTRVLVRTPSVHITLTMSERGRRGVYS